MRVMRFCIFNKWSRKTKDQAFSMHWLRPMHTHKHLVANVVTQMINRITRYCFPNPLWYHKSGIRDIPSLFNEQGLSKWQKVTFQHHSHKTKQYQRRGITIYIISQCRGHSSCFVWLTKHDVLPCLVPSWFSFHCRKYTTPTHANDR